MAKLYWADHKDSESWCGPHADIDECKRVARIVLGEDGGEIWVAPVDAELDDDDGFWAAVADRLLCEAEQINDGLAEEGYIDPEEPWLDCMIHDRDGIVADALRKVLGPRPKWRTVDTAKAERVTL